MLPLDQFFKSSIRLLGSIGAVGLVRTVGIAVAAVVAIPSLASATIVNSTATSFIGEEMTATLTIDDESQPGDLVITLSLDAGAVVGDLRGFYMQIADESLLAGLSISGADVSDSAFAANSVNNFGWGTYITTGSSGCLFNGCDLGVEVGTHGIQNDDLQSVTFVLSHSVLDLTVDVFADQIFALRVSNAGIADGERSGFSKLAGVVVVPEPSTAILMLLGLTGLTVAGRAPKAQSA